MKPRNIVSVMCIMAIAFTACVNEILVDGPETAQTGDLSIVFAVGDAQTKTEAAAGYEWATPDELHISHVTIAVFEDNSCIGFVKNPELTSGTVTVDGKSLPAYQASLKGLPINKPLAFVVIANSTNEFSGLGIGSPYSAFEKLTEETGGFPHAEGLAKTLVKVGKTTATLSLETTEVQVPLRSLSARIDFGGVTSLADKAETTEVMNDEYGNWVQLEYTDENRSLMDNLLTSVENYDDIQKLDDKGWGEDKKKENGVIWHPNFYYYREKKGRFTTTRISFYKQEIKKNRKQIITQGAYWQGPITLSGANKSSYVLYTTANQSLYTKANDAICSDTTFYSYPSGDSQFQLVFTLQCGIGESITDEYDSQVCYAYVVQEWSWGNYSPGDPYPTGEETVTFSHDKKTDDLKVCRSEDVGKVSNQTVKDPDYETCRLTINGNQLRAGHLYRLTGTYNPPVSQDIIWEVADWDANQEVDIEFGKEN